jgi:hypothetical protein
VSCSSSLLARVDFDFDGLGFGEVIGDEIGDVWAGDARMSLSEERRRTSAPKVVEAGRRTLGFELLRVSSTPPTFVSPPLALAPEAGEPSAKSEGDRTSFAELFDFGERTVILLDCLGTESADLDSMRRLLLSLSLSLSLTELWRFTLTSESLRMVLSAEVDDLSCNV